MNDKVMNELSEGDDANLLDKLKALADETGAESERIKRELYAGELTAEKAVQEFAETCMPLLRDLTQQVFGVQQHAILFRQAASPRIWPEEDAGEDGLWPEDAQIFKKLLENYRALLANSLEQANDDAIKTAAQKELALITRAIKRVDELTIQDDDGPEQSEGDDDEEEQDESEDDEDKPN